MSGLPVITVTSKKTSLLPVEVVERKGTGHPDTICDAVAEEFSRGLCRYYYEHFGLVLHHNVDKGLLVAGTSEPSFGGGKIKAPLRLILAGRATTSFKGHVVPVKEIAIETTKKWFRDNFHALDPDRDIEIDVIIRPGSQELVELFLRQAREGEIPLANDTSCGIGFYPLTPLERAVYETERLLNSKNFKKENPATGQDVKIMGVRRAKEEVSLTVACAFVDRFLRDMHDYMDEKEKVGQFAREILEKEFENVDIFVNTADRPESGSIYLTVTGTSAESGDDGEVGRGNRANGLITPMRPMNMEAVSGKNPINHVGKIYNLKAQEIAKRLYEEIPEVSECTCFLVSQIGRPITTPAAGEIRICSDKELSRDSTKKIQEIYRQEMKESVNLWKSLLEEKKRIY